MSAATDSKSRTNWSGNITFQAQRLYTPRSVEELQELVASSERIRALGSRHSFNSIADTRGEQVSLSYLRSMSLDEASSTVTVGGGVTYAELAPFLDARGFALHNLASLPHITVAGAVQTGTHGSGLRQRNLSSAVLAMELITAQGELMHVSRPALGEQFDGMVVALGALGIAASLTLRVQPTYLVRQQVYERLRFDVLKGNLREVFASGYSVSLFTHWVDRTASQVWVKSRVETCDRAPAEFFSARAAVRELHPLPQHSPENCTPQMGLPGPWYERLPHFRTEFTPSSGNELQTEYFVPLDQGPAAIEAVAALGERIAPLLFVSELRAIAADELWLSPCYRRESLALHFTWRPEWTRVRELLPLIEAALAPFGARPHWAKLFTMAPERVRNLYPRLPQLSSLSHGFDPSRKFHNTFIERYISP